VLTIALLYTQAFAFTSCPSFIEINGVEVSIPKTTHDSFATPDCKSLGLVAPSDLKCDDGEWKVYNPEADEKFSLSDSPFSICLDAAAEYGIVEETGGNVYHLRKFWETVKSSFSEANNCPTEALECYTFDVFGERYERDGGALDSFIDLIPLDTSSELEYLATVGQNVREFVFYDGLLGRVIELDSGETYTTLNADDVEDFQLFVHPTTFEDGNWKYVIYREDTTEEVEIAEADNHSERRKLTKQAMDVEFLQERLMGAPEHQRRMLQNTDYVSVTFLYDATIQSYSNARSHAISTVITMNHALGIDFDYQVVLKAVVRATDGSFRPGSNTMGCKNGASMNDICDDEHNKLSTSQKGDLVHCYVAKDVFVGKTVGCAIFGGSGATEIGHSYSIQIGVHEMGHQLYAHHDDSHCWCPLKKTYWDWGCFCTRTKCAREYCTLMNSRIKTSTEHLVQMTMSAANKDRARAKSHFANNQHDAFTWKHCSEEHGSCRCDGTVRYGRDGRWASPKPVRGRILCSNSRFGDPYPGVVKKCECAAITWKHCSDEHGSCKCDGTVRYGIHGRYANPKQVRGQIHCSNSVFGVDPLRGVLKKCECLSGEY